MDKKMRRTTSVALSLGLLPAFLGLAGCSDETSSLPPSKETGARARDARQKAREYGTTSEKAAPAEGQGR